MCSNLFLFQIEFHTSFFSFFPPSYNTILVRAREHRGADSLDLPDFLADHLGAFHLPLVPEHGERQVANEQALAETPHERDGVEEVGVPAAGVDPQVVKRGP